MSQFLNPLHTPEWIQRCINTQGRVDLTRRTGQSTAQALHCIANAINCPYKPQPIKDHSGSYAADEHLAEMVKQIVSILALDHMTVERKHGVFTLQFGK